MNRAMTFVDPALMINYDATGFEVGYDSKRKVQVSYAKSERSKKKSLKTTRTKDEKGGISKLIIKLFLLINAIGDQDAPTYIIADPNIQFAFLFEPFFLFEPKLPKLHCIFYSIFELAGPSYFIISFALDTVNIIV